MIFAFLPGARLCPILRAIARLENSHAKAANQEIAYQLCNVSDNWAQGVGMLYSSKGIPKSSPENYQALQDKGLFPHSNTSTSRGPKGSTRLPWIVLWFVLLVMILAVANAVFAFRRDTDLLRQDLEATDGMQTQAIAEMIRDPVAAGDWEAVQRLLKRMEGTLANTHLRVTDAGGAPLADSQRAWQTGPVALQKMLPVARTNGERKWLSPQRVLQMQRRITNERGLVMAVLMKETDYQEKFVQLNATVLSRTINYLVGVLLILGMILLVNWKLFLDPLNQIYHIAHTVQQGNRTAYMPDSNILELQRIGTAFNAMIDHLAGQQADLETLNRNLEATVTERTTALETNNFAILKRADQLEAINGLIASTAGVMDMQALVDTALEQMVHILQADVGALVIGEMVVLVEIDAAAYAFIIQTALACYVLETDTLVERDWETTGSEDGLYPLALAMKKNGLRSSISIPIFASGKLAGHIGLANKQPRVWTADEVALLEIIAHHLATAMERTQSMENLKGHNDLMRQMVAQSERLNRTFTQREVIATIGEGALALGQAERGALFIKNNGENLECAWSRGLSEGFIQQVTACAKKMYRQDEPGGPQADLTALLITDIKEQGNDFPYLQLEPGERFTGVGVWPLVFENRASAIVCCYYDAPKVWKQNEQEVLDTFFRQAAVALENARLFEAECTQRQLAEALRDVAATLSSSLELDEVLDGILCNLGRVVPHSAAVVMLLEDDVLRPARWQGMPEERQEQFKNWRYPVRELVNRQWMVETVQALVIADTSQNADWIRTAGLEWVQSYAGAPICQHGVVTGFIDVMSPQAGFYNQDTAPIMEAFANQAAIALENARLYQNSQQRMAETSALYRAVQPLFSPVENIEALARGITESVTKEFSSAHCSILLLDESSNPPAIDVTVGFAAIERAGTAAGRAWPDGESSSYRQACLRSRRTRGTELHSWSRSHPVGACDTAAGEWADNWRDEPGKSGGRCLRRTGAATANIIRGAGRAGTGKRTTVCYHPGKRKGDGETKRDGAAPRPGSRNHPHGNHGTKLYVGSARGAGAHSGSDGSGRAARQRQYVPGGG